MAIQDLLILCNKGIVAALSWFLAICNAIPDAFTTILTFFALYTVVRVLISPLVGSAGSDAVKEIRKEYGKKEKSDG